VGCIELAHALSATVVAEGVETAAQLSRLTELGCDIAQGYHYARPLRAESLPSWLTA
jgi:EAL domain-containing protein (putative c-di-GMP-specific phosphodiesterase class I)